MLPEAPVIPRITFIYYLLVIIECIKFFYDKKFYFLLLKTKYSTNTDATMATIAPTYSSVR